MNNVPKISDTIGFSIKNKPEALQKSLINIESYIADMPKSLKLILEKLNNDAEKISSVAYKWHNYILIPEKSYNHEQMITEASKYMDKNKSILQFAGYKNLTEDTNIYVYKIEEETQELVKYNKDTVTDKAKQDFYYNLKELIQNGKVDITEILDRTKWYMTKDGQTIYHISPHLNGHITSQNKEKASKQLFDTLFNNIQ